MLSFRHLKIFQTIAETENFTKAAQKLYITQSAVSHAIKELEQDTRMVLFDRLSKRVQLTANGKLLLEEVTPILIACDSLEKRLGRLEQQAPLQIVSSITIATYWLPNILQEVKKQLPDTPFNVKVVTATDAIHTLQAGYADIAFIEGTQPEGQFCCKPFADYTLQAVCSPAYPLPAHKMSIRDFCAEKLLLREPGSAIRDVLDSQLYLLGHTAHPSWVSVNSTALIEAAKAGLGITILPEVLLKDELAKKTLVPLQVEGMHLKNNIIAVYHKDKHITPALKILLSCV
ncbi:LysR family transcriptional regulator [Listeria monocytogenes]|nr:LysR family transcriptional regulator [Listeria monocytogenes]EEP2907175.1 LysR family transcriptional regulator [Listeria monocytogenes]EEP2907591.1 LysR family transcriptional regulator [Listeria monocytogenes]EEP6699453.1 LysR family transcriptional regulator [Listeria monocytogenes]HAA9544614.1 LysR family transcriptional regulator [Listeria monocytogenes]